MADEICMNYQRAVGVLLDRGCKPQDIDYVLINHFERPTPGYYRLTDLMSYQPGTGG